MPAEELRYLLLWMIVLMLVIGGVFQNMSISNLQKAVDACKPTTLQVAR